MQKEISSNNVSSVYMFGMSFREKGAVADYFLSLGNELVSRGHRVIFVIDQQRYDLENHDTNPAFYTFPSKVPTKINDFLFILNLIHRYHPKCIVGVWRGVNVMALSGWISKVKHRIVWYRTTSKQSVFEKEGPSPFKRKFQVERKKIVYHLVTSIITSTEAMKQDLFNVYGVNLSKVLVSPNAIRSPNKKFLNLPKNPNKIVCIGRLCKLKGQEVLIKAASLLKPGFPDLSIEFFGSGDPSEFQALANELDVNNFCHFKGKISHDSVLENLATSAISIVPSKGEAFGYVNIESMSVGTPVIASNVGGIPEIIRDGVDGFLVPPDDPVALANRIRQLLLDPELRKKMGENARENFQKNYTLESISNKQAIFFENLK